MAELRQFRGPWLTLNRLRQLARTTLPAIEQIIAIGPYAQAGNHYRVATKAYSLRSNKDCLKLNFFGPRGNALSWVSLVRRRPSTRQLRPMKLIRRQGYHLTPPPKCSLLDDDPTQLRRQFPLGANP
jgi:hypothetical protein